MGNKKILLAVMLLLITLLPVYAQYDSEGDFETKLSENGKSLWIIKYLGNKQNINIPPKIKGLPVSKINNSAFAEHNSIISVIIPNSVTSIGEEAFSNCTSLTGITIPNSVTNIGKSAFYNCNSLTEVTMPDRITSIGERVFQFCHSLNSITIPNSVTSIGKYAFNQCFSLTGITIPNSVISIGEAAFFYCSSLTKITIPNSVTSIGEDPFGYCANLIEINVDSGNREYSAENGILYNKNKTSLIQYPTGKIGSSFNIPNSVINIGDLAFRYNTNLTGVTISSNIASIGYRAFRDCPNLTSVTFKGTIMREVGYYFDFEKMREVEYHYDYELDVYITDEYFNNEAFHGDLHEKFYEKDIKYGTPGTYTTTAPVNENSKWTRKP